MKFIPKEIKALRKAQADMAKEFGNMNQIANEGVLDDFFDDHVTTKDSPIYEQGDGETEIAFKKMVKKCRRDKPC